MRKEHRIRTFKSGNSIAMRLPKALGLVDGEDMTIIAHRDGSFSLWKAENAKAVFMALYGSLSASFMADGRALTEPQERDWSATPGSAEAA